jgi:phosphatidylglycerophosphate synthase
MGLAAVGVMPREVRLVILSIGLILGGVLGVTPTGGGGAMPFGIGVLFLALGIILVGSVITVIQRIVHVRSQAKHQATTTSTTTPPETR